VVKVVEIELPVKALEDLAQLMELLQAVPVACIHHRLLWAVRATLVFQIISLALSTLTPVEVAVAATSKQVQMFQEQLVEMVVEQDAVILLHRGRSME
jgi:hypothetical protein